MEWKNDDVSDFGGEDGIKIQINSSLSSIEKFIF